eukprot:4060560-Pleurochrysis_carterae.AAC.1
MNTSNPQLASERRQILATSLSAHIVAETTRRVERCARETRRGAQLPEAACAKRGVRCAQRARGDGVLVTIAVLKGVNDAGGDQGREEDSVGHEGDEGARHGRRGPNIA